MCCESGNNSRDASASTFADDTFQQHGRDDVILALVLTLAELNYIPVEHVLL
jgi:hypothetical protein